MLVYLGMYYHCTFTKVKYLYLVLLLLTIVEKERGETFFAFAGPSDKILLKL